MLNLSKLPPLVTMKVYHMSDKNLLIIGDPIMDHYFLGTVSQNRFQQDQEVICSGGAANIVENILAILSKQEGMGIWCTDNWDTAAETKLFRVNRYIQDNQLVLETRTAVKEVATKFYAPISSFMISQHSKPVTGLIIGDYNKGMVNNNSAGCAEDMPEIDFCIVDSRHKNLNLDLIKTCKCKIWHCSGNEFDPEFAKNFDWIIDSQGSGPVLVRQQFHLTNESMVRLYLDVPTTTKVIDTCGAGDTMVAAIASYLILEDTSEIDINMITEATKFAIQVCQDVVSQPYTAKTTITL